MPNYKNIPIASPKNIPLALLAQYDGGFVGGYGRRRRYTRATQIEKFAVEKYKKMVRESHTLICFCMEGGQIKGKVKLL